MVRLNRQGRVCRAIFACVGGILLLLASVTLLYAALKNWDFTTTTDYTFDSDKIDVSSGLAKLKTVTFIHDEEDEFSGTQSNTQWATDHIELDAAGLSSGSGTYTSQIIDSGVAGTQWGKISWTEALNQDSASFSPTKSVGSLSTGLSVFGADIDGDDDIDVVVLQGSNPLSHYFENDGAEAFTSRTININKPKDTQDLHVADINKDGRLDVVAIGSSELDWFENQGGTPPTWKKLLINPKPSSGLEVEVADVNGDGNLDVIIGDASNVQWYENNGANPPSWTDRAVDSTLTAVDALSTGDLDGDGDLDLLAGDEAGLYWYENNGANPPLFTKRNIDTTIVNAESIIAADLNNDGKLDVVAVGLSGLNLSWYENDGSSPPGFTKRTVDSGPLTSPVSVAAGDIDRDGNLDLALVEGADLHWYRNEGGAVPTWTKTTLTTGTVSGGDHLFLVNLENDVNGDGDLDIVVAEQNQVSWWENLLPHSNIRFQLRTSDGTSWSSWQGPGGRTTSSYTDPTGGTITIPDGRYIQYRAFIKTHNSTSLNAQLSMVRLDLTNQVYPTDNPTVQNKTGPDYTSISSFTENLGEGNQGVVKYQLSNNGTVWYYHSGSLWVPAAQGFTHANTAAEVNTSISSFDDDVGTGTFYFKAFLNSDGNQQVELDKVEIDFSGLPTQLAFSVQPSNAEVGAAISPAIKVQVQDANGKLITTATDLVTLAIGTNPGGATLAGTLTVTAVGGEATFNDISIDKIGSGYILTASSGGLTSATSSAFNVAAGAASQLVLSVQPANAEAKASISPAVKVQVQDAGGNLVTTATNSITLAIGTNPGGATLAGTLTVAAVGGEATFSGISIDKAGSGYTLVASASGLSSATSSAFNITAAALNQLVFSVQPSSANAKTAISPAIKVQVKDANGKLITTATDPITLAIGTNPGGATLAGTLTVATVGGEATFNDISIDKIGTGYILTASSDGLTSATSSAFNVAAGAASQLVFSVQPSSAEVKASISPDIKVQVKDANGYLVTTATDPITLAIGTNSSGSAKLAGTLTLAAVGGQATFSTISLDKAGSGYTLVAIASGLTSATSAAFNVTAGAATQVSAVTTGAPTQLVFSVQPSNAVAKASISTAIKVQVQDSSGKLVNTVTLITLAMGSKSGGTKLAGTLTVATVGGEATFSNISIDKAGSGYTLVASALGLTSATSAAFNVAAGAASQLVFSVQPSSAKAKASISPAIKVQVQDAGGNLVTTATNSIKLAIGINSSGGTLGGTLTAATVGGEATLSKVSIDKAGSGYTLVATASGLTSAKSSAFNITVGAATKLVFSVQPSSAKAKVAISPAIKVQVQDAGGNLVTKATDPITLAMGSESGGAKLAGTSEVGAVEGEATFSNISIDEAGSGFTLVASASGLSSATSPVFNITAGAVEQVASSDETPNAEASEQTSDAEAEAADAANKLVFSVQPSSAEARAAISPPIKVQVKDANGKLVNTTSTITLTISTNPGGATLAGTLKLAAVGGEATFSSISLDKAGSGYTLIASGPGLTSTTSAGFGITEGQQLASGANPGVPVAGSSPVFETVLDTAKQDAPGDETAVNSEEETGVTSTKKDDTPQTIAKATDTSQSGSKAILEDASTAIPQIPQKLAVLKDEPTTVILNREIVMETGNSVTIQLRAPSGTAPEIDVYDANNVLQVSAAVMTEVGSTGVYEYTLNLDSKWGVGDFTVIASDSNRGTLNRMTLKVGAATSADGTKVETDTDETIPVLLEDVQTRLETVDTKLSRAVEEIRVSLNATAGTKSANPQTLEIESIHDRIREISNLLKQVSNENGINLDVMYGSIDESTADFIELLDKVERLKVLLNLNREVSEKVLEDSKKPVTKVWFESGSVILKILVVNPSKTETLTIPLIIKLPKEVSPEDIIDIGDLRLDYDMETGLYTVKDELTLEPGQSMIKFVKMEDIWLIEEERLSSLVVEAEEVASRLNDTPYAEEAAALVEVIEGKIEEIKRKQEETSDSPGEHIRAYRQGLTTIVTIKQDLSEMDSLGQEFSKIEVPGKGLLAEGSFLESGGSGSGEVAGSETPLADPESQ